VKFPKYSLPAGLYPGRLGELKRCPESRPPVRNKEACFSGEGKGREGKGKKERWGTGKGI